jgi:hypothetical protein
MKSQNSVEASPLAERTMSHAGRGYTFARCIDLSKAQVVVASRSHDQCRALLEHLASISRPQDGGPLVLLLLARLATVAGAWLDGELRIELRADDEGTGTIVDVMTTLGYGMAERVFPRFRFAVPLSEFEGAMTRVPEMTWPLLLEKCEGCIKLSATRDVRMHTMPPAIGGCDGVQELLAGSPGRSEGPSGPEPLPEPLALSHAVGPSGT